MNISAYIQYFSASKSKVTNIKEQTVGKLVSDSVITKVVGLIENLLVVKYQIKLVDSLSNGQRHISIIPTLNDSINGIYSVKVAEDNGQNYVSYFNFLVDAKTMKVLNPNGESVVK